MNDFKKNYMFEQQVSRRNKFKKIIMFINNSINTFSQQALKYNKSKEIINAFNVNYNSF